MRKWILLSVFMAAMPFNMMAQDDLYFNPKQEAKQRAAEREAEERELASHYSGSKRSVDEYNRHGKFMSQFQKVGTDSLGNDIITFRVGHGVSPDSIYDDAAFVQKYLENSSEDYEYTRNMSRWDGYYNPWFYDYYGYGPYYWRAGYWGWRNPWRYGYYAGWYDPWFDPWYDPWYYGYAGWYSPWHYGWGGWYNPWYWSGPVVAHVNYGPGGAIRKNYGFQGRNGGAVSTSANRRGGTMSRRNANNMNFGSRTTYRNTNINTNGSRITNSNVNHSFGGGGSRSGGFSGGSFGGGRSGATGGGSFGGRRR